MNSFGLRPDLHGTIFVACAKLTAGLRHDLRLPQRFKTCFKMLRHFFDVHTNRKSCRRPVVSLSHETKIVRCKSALQTTHVQHQTMLQCLFLLSVSPFVTDNSQTIVTSAAIKIIPNKCVIRRFYLRQTKVFLLFIIRYFNQTRNKT